VIASGDLAIQDRSLFTIVGTYRYFLQFTKEAPTVVGNLDSLSTLLGFTISHELWVKLHPGASGETILTEISAEFRFRPANAHNPAQSIIEQNAQYERTGVWGTYTTGFLAAAFMAILGFVVYSVASLQCTLWPCCARWGWTN
jgi:hypothetical protein